MKSDLLRIPAALLALLLAGCGVGPVVWQKTLDIGGDETATALTSDGTNYYVSFVATRPGGSDRAGWFVTKLDSSGSEVWTQMYRESPYAMCQDLWADTLGPLFAAGRSKSEGQDICLVIRYAAGGEIIWQKGLSVGEKTWGTGICPVSGDRIAVCGVAGTDADTDYMIALLDARDGRTVWVKNLDLGPNDLAARIACDADDNLTVVGLHGENAANPDIVIIKIAPNGDTLWTRRYDSGGSDEPGDIAFDGFGNVIATGTARVGDSVRCVIIEYAPNGDLIRKLAYGTVAQATGRGIFVTKDSEVFIAGSLLLQDGKSEILAFQYRPDAVSVWQKQYSPGPSAGGIDLVVNEDVCTAATVQGKTKDVLVCRFLQLNPEAVR
ncbi:hypothetical protein FJY68_09705 [candidate division WOR-3 bacterium]|uniref:Bulb-type lectin domain-containing protein n=1 Tax=candidate division WOR-3 bacterium TaxID=2052148 RepID=A0A937XFA3_UNCW3|nr:hypothetical protein [candidate division WOR-3 bacterium]